MLAELSTNNKKTKSKQRRTDKKLWPGIIKKKAFKSIILLMILKIVYFLFKKTNIDQKI
jgi:hypothetical protein